MVTQKWPYCNTDADLFVRACEILGEFKDNDQPWADSETTKGLKQWKPTELGYVTQYTMGDKTSSRHIRLISRPLQQRYGSGGFEEAHLSFILNDGPQLYEHEVIADGNCWLRAILMQLPHTRHGQKQWDPATGNLMSGLAKPTPVAPHTLKATRLLAPLLEELEAVSVAVAEFIKLNPDLLADALRAATLATHVEDMADLPQGRVEYEYRIAYKWYLRGTYFTHLSHAHKRQVLNKVQTNYGGLPATILFLTVYWCIRYDDAAVLLRAYHREEWSLAPKMGMILKKGLDHPITIKELAQMLVPNGTSEEEMILI